MFDVKKYQNALKSDLELILKEIQSVSSQQIAIDLELDKSIYKKFYRRKYLYETGLGEVSALQSDYFQNFRNQIWNFQLEKRDTFSKGWLPEGNTDSFGRQIVQKKNYEKKLVLSGSFLIDRIIDDTDEEQRNIRVKFNDGIKLEEYFHFWGKTLPDDLAENKNQVRIYFNFNPNHTEFQHNLQKFAQTFFVKFNRRKIPFQIKFALDSSKYYADNVVLYLERRYLITFLDYIFEEAKFFDNILRKEVPMFTYELMPGIGFAEGIDPVFFAESFGFKKTSFISELLKNKPQITINQLLETIKNEYRKDGLFFLNKDSRFEYEYSSILNIALKQKDISEKNDKSYFLNLATRIGYSICKEAFWDDKGRCSWIGFSSSKSFKSVDISYLEGLGGILLFFTEIFSITHKPLFKRYSIGLLNTLFDRVFEENSAIKNGFYVGTGGILYVIQKAITAFELQYIFQDKFNQIKELYLKQSSINQPLDVFGGIAGNLWSLLLLKQLDDSNSQYDAKIKEYAHQLIENGLWKTDPYFLNKIPIGVQEQYEYMIGFPHGVTGIAYVLDLYQHIMNDTQNKENINNKVIEAITYENTHRRYKEKQIWFDIFTVNGAPGLDWEERLLGIGYSRLALKEQLDNNLFETNIKNILARCEKLSSSYLRKISSALLDFMIETQNQGFVWSKKVKKNIDTLMKEYKNETLEFKSKNNEPNFVHPSLIGTAGFGISILRLYDSKAVKSYILPS